MNTKSFLIAGLVGGIIKWLLGWMFYGVLPEDFFTQPKDSIKTMVSILAGCLTVGLFISYIFNRWAKVSTAKNGVKAGLIIGVFMGLISNLFNMAFLKGLTYGMFATDVIVTIFTMAITGGVIGLLLGKLNRSSL